MKTYLCIVITLLLSGCTSISVVSDDAEFSNYKLKTIILGKPVLVCKDQALKTETSGVVEYRLVYNVNNLDKCFFGETIGRLMAGEVIEIESIEKHHISNFKSATHIYFIGTGKLPQKGVFQFYYLYGHEGYYENQPW